MIYFKTKRYNCTPRVLEFKNKADLLEYFEFLYQKRLPHAKTISDICNAFENDFQIFRRISAKELKKIVDN